MLKNVEDIAIKAGQRIWEIYQAETVDVEMKDDNSPITKADLEANDIIMKGLEKFSDIPILSEEALVDYGTRKSWQKYWLVDPLDGTKGFIKRTGDFTVNIALIDNEVPVMGVIYVPGTKELYCAEQGKGATKNGQPIKNPRTGPPKIAVASKLHSGGETEWMKSLGVEETINVNSSLKLCWLAEGRADIYPRLKPTMEWDTGAGEIILKEAGCDIVQLETLEAMPHNQEDLTNPSFLAYRTSVGFTLAGPSGDLPQLV